MQSCTQDCWFGSGPCLGSPRLSSALGSPITAWPVGFSGRWAHVVGTSPFTEEGAETQ